MNISQDTPRAKFHLLRNRRSKKKTTKPLRDKQTFQLEPLENRLLLSVTVLGAGIPTWTSQGPAPITNTSQTPAPPNNEVSGAVQSIAVDPNNAGSMWIGTTNGGVWHTTNANPNNPGAITWTPTMDQMPSLAIGAVTIDPNDPSGNTIWAGTGSFSN